MNLQKLLTLRAGYRSLLSSLISKIENSKENGTSEEFNAVLHTLDAKAEALTTLDEKILPQTEMDGMEEEIVSTGEYTMEIDLQLTRFRAYQVATSRQHTEPTINADENVAEDRRRPADDESTEHRGQRTSQPPAKETTANTDERGSEHTTAREDGGRIHREEAQTNGEEEQSENRRENYGDEVRQRNQEQRSYVPRGTVPETVSNVSFSSVNSAQYHRLPKLSLPTFDGNILNWQTFWDSFESTVHCNPNLTDVQKFSYLKPQLELEAARTIDGFALTNTNYIRAIELLHERYGQKHKIIHATMQALLQLPAPTQTLHSMREFYDKMETYVRGLESLGQQQETYGDLLVPIVLDKLPEETRKHLARERGDINWFLGDIRRALKKEIYIMEAGMCTLSRPQTEPY